MMADALIRIERSLYDSQANDKVNAPFTLVAKEQANSKVVDLTFEPADDTPPEHCGSRAVPLSSY